MKTDLQDIQDVLRNSLKSHVPPLQIRQENKNLLEVAGTKEAIQGKQLVSGFYFGSVVPKPKDIRFYFFPIYTHPDQFHLSPELKKCLKGKSCFHFKKLTPELEKEINQMIKKGIDCYLQQDLI